MTETPYRDKLNLAYAHYPRPILLFCNIASLHHCTVAVSCHSGADPGGAVLGVRNPPPPLPFLGDFKIDGKMSHACAQMERVLVLNSYPDAPFPKSCIRPCHSLPMYSFSYNFSFSLSIWKTNLKPIASQEYPD